MENTCGNCPKMKISDLGCMTVACCGEDDSIIPHQTTISDDRKSWNLIFWRIPLFCPREDVIKSEEQAPEKGWVRTSVKSIRGNK